MRLLAFLAALVALFPVVPASAQTAPPSAVSQLTSEQWRQDLRFMVAEMKARHANLYHQVSREKFEAAVADLDRRIPQLQRNQIIVGLMRIAALVGDGHTRVDPRKDKAFGFGSLPLRFYWFDDGIFVRAARPDFRDLLGARVEAIGGVPIEEAIRRASDIVSKENMSGGRLMIPIYLGMPDILQALGLSESTEMASLTLVRGGKRWIANVPIGEAAALWPPDTDASLFTPDGWADARTTAQPAWLQAPLDYHRFVPMPASSALYAQLNMITDTKDETLAAFGRRILEESNRTNPRAVILDLRLSYGGNGDLRNAFIPGLIRVEDSDTKLFVLTARGTFSASQFLLDDLDRLTGAVFIGEPASSRPTGYGDGYRSTMPNSGISIRTSIKRWQSGQDMRDWTPVDLAPSFRFEDYVAGRDPALDAALRFAPSQLMVARLSVAAATSVHELDRLAEDPLFRYADLEQAGTMVAQRLLSSDKAAALRLARWTATRLPKSSDAATVLAFVAQAAADPVLALASAKRAVALDPNNRAVRSILEGAK